MRSSRVAISLPKVPEGGGGGGAPDVELEPPCGPSSARATDGAAKASKAIRQRHDTYLLTFLISILLLFSRHYRTVTSRLKVNAHLSRNSFTKSIVAYSR